MTNKRMTYEQAQFTTWGILYGDRIDAEYIARRITGTLDWQGMTFEIIGISGLGTDVQRWVNKVCLGWKVIEIQYGDGSSKYKLGDCQNRKRHAGIIDCKDYYI